MVWRHLGTCTEQHHTTEETYKILNSKVSFLIRRALAMGARLILLLGVFGEENKSVRCTGLVSCA